MIDSVAAGATTAGISVVTPGVGGGNTIVMVERSSIVNNATGFNASGPKSFGYLTGTTVFGNSTGLATPSGGSIQSYQNNSIIGGNSPTDGAPTSTLNRN